VLHGGVLISRKLSSARERTGVDFFYRPSTGTGWRRRRARFRREAVRGDRLLKQGGGTCRRLNRASAAADARRGSYARAATGRLVYAVPERVGPTLVEFAR